MRIAAKSFKIECAVRIAHGASWSYLCRFRVRQDLLIKEPCVFNTWVEILNQTFLYFNILLDFKTRIILFQQFFKFIKTLFSFRFRILVFKLKVLE